MSILIALFTLISFAAPRCVEIFDVPVKIAPPSVALAKSTTQDDFLKNFLALNLSFPQHRSTISFGMTAFYFARGMTFELIYKNLTEDQWNLIYVSMLRAHSTYGVKKTVTMAETEFVLASFTMTMRYRIARTQTWLETHFGSKDSAYALARIQRYSETMLGALRSPEARELSRRFREDLKPLEDKAPSPRFTREQISDEMREIVKQKLQDAHPELSETMALALYESMT